MTLFTTLLYHSPLNERMLRISENKCISYPMLRNAFFKRSHWLKTAILFAYDSESSIWEALELSWGHSLGCPIPAAQLGLASLTREVVSRLPRWALHSIPSGLPGGSVQVYSQLWS